MEYPETDGADSDPDWEQLCRRNLGTCDTYSLDDENSTDEGKQQEILFDSLKDGLKTDEKNRKTMPTTITDDLS